MNRHFSIAYFAPAAYFARISEADTVFMEAEENFVKQTYRNRCEILAANGTLALTVPVRDGSFHKVKIKDVKIDYTKRWQQIHIRSLESAYKSSPYYQYYCDKVNSVINSGSEFLLDLNIKSAELIFSLTGIETGIELTKNFMPPNNEIWDFRYSITPKRKQKTPERWINSQYHQVFDDKYGFTPGLSILDLLFNKGPDTAGHIATERKLNRQ
jgi:hypothetical protein